MRPPAGCWIGAGVVVLTAALACGPRDCVVGTGEAITREIPMATIRSVVNTGSFHVEVIKGEPQRVEVIAQPEIIEVIKPTVDNGVWRIGASKCFSGSIPVHIRITVPLLNLIATEGSGEVHSGDVFNSGRTDFRITGSGGIVVSGINEERVVAILEGSGSLEMAGTCRELEASLSGSGSMKAEGLNVNEADFNCSGSGSASLTVISTLDAEVSGSGGVGYRGSPDVKSKVTGSGAVAPL